MKTSIYLFLLILFGFSHICQATYIIDSPPIINISNTINAADVNIESNAFPISVSLTANVAAAQNTINITNIIDQTTTINYIGGNLFATNTPTIGQMLYASQDGNNSNLYWAAAPEGGGGTGGGSPILVSNIFDFSELESTTVSGLVLSVYDNSPITQQVNTVNFGFPDSVELVNRLSGVNKFIVSTNPFYGNFQNAVSPAIAGAELTVSNSSFRYPIFSVSGDGTAAESVQITRPLVANTTNDVTGVFPVAQTAGVGIKPSLVGGDLNDLLFIEGFYSADSVIHVGTNTTDHRYLRGDALGRAYTAPSIIERENSGRIRSYEMAGSFAARVVNRNWQRFHFTTNRIYQVYADSFLRQYDFENYEELASILKTGVVNNTSAPNPAGGDLRDVAASPDNEVILIGRQGSTMLLSTNSGTTWTSLTGPGSKTWYGVTVHTNKQIMHAIAYNQSVDGLYRTTNAWTTFQAIDLDSLAGASGSFLYHSMASDGGDNIVVTTLNGLNYRSFDAGVTWEVFNLPGGASYVSVTYNKMTGVWTANSRSTIVTSTNVFNDLIVRMDASTSISDGNIQNLEFVSKNNTLYAASQQRIYKVTEPELNTVRLENLLTHPSTAARSFKTSPDGNLFTSPYITPSYVYYSTDEGNLWKFMRDPLDGSTALYPDFAGGSSIINNVAPGTNKLYMYTGLQHDDGLALYLTMLVEGNRSELPTVDWISRGLPTISSSGNYTWGEPAVRDGVMYVGVNNGTVLTSSDTGQTWRILIKSFDNTTVTDTGPGVASTNMAILDSGVSCDLTITNVSNANLTQYDCGVSMTGRFVVMRLIAHSFGNPGGKELVLGYDSAAPTDPLIPAITLLGDPVSATASSEFGNQPWAVVEHLYDGSVTSDDIGTTANQGGEYVGQGVGPHVVVYDMGSSVTFNSILYAQRGPEVDAVGRIQFWVLDDTDYLKDNTGVSVGPNFVYQTRAHRRDQVSTATRYQYKRDRFYNNVTNTIELYQGTSKSVSFLHTLDDTNIWIATVGGAIQKSTDGGVTVANTGSGNRNWSAVCTVDNTNLLATVYGGLVYQSSNSGTNWSEYTILNGGGNKYWVCIDMPTTNFWVLTQSDGNIVYTEDAGMNWIEVLLAGTWSFNGATLNGIRVDPFNTNLVLMSTFSSVKYSTNGVLGTFMDFPTYGPPSNPTINISPADYSRLEVSPLDDNILLATTSNGGEVYKTVDGGKSFTLVVDINDTISSISTIDGVTWYLTTDFGSIWVSYDVGETWQTLPFNSRYALNLQDITPTDVPNKFYTAGYGSGELLKIEPNEFAVYTNWGFAYSTPIGVNEWDDITDTLSTYSGFQNNNLYFAFALDGTTNDWKVLKNGNWKSIVTNSGSAWSYWNGSEYDSAATLHAAFQNSFLATPNNLLSYPEITGITPEQWEISGYTNSIRIMVGMKYYNDGDSFKNFSFIADYVQGIMSRENDKDYEITLSTNNISTITRKADGNVDAEIYFMEIP